MRLRPPRHLLRYRPPLPTYLAPALSRPFTRDSTLPTIFALSTPPGKSAIAVIRISGPLSRTIHRALTAPSLPHSPPTPRRAHLHRLLHPQTRLPLDPAAITLFFPGPNSHTGEDVLELHLHGGPAIVRAVLAAIPLCAPERGGAAAAVAVRYAEPGEFTRRALWNGRLPGGVMEVEALGEWVDAATEEQRKRVVGGHVRRRAERYEEWRRMLVAARGELEAAIDFAEDQGFEEAERGIVDGVAAAARRLKGRLSRHVDEARRGELVRGGISLSLAGAPNAGKSSLLNRVVGREAVIVSEEAGTTRDVVDLAVDLGGFMVVLGDTAGLRVDDLAGRVGRVESEGIRRARQRVMDGDVVVVVTELSVLPDGRESLLIPDEVVAVVNDADAAGKQIVIAVNKIDLLPGTTKHPLPVGVIRQLNDAFPNVKEERIFGITCTEKHDHDGIQRLLKGLEGVFREMTDPRGEGMQREEAGMALGATERQRLLVEGCVAFLDNFLEMAERGGEVDVVAAAEELRGAAECLARITGRGEAGDVEEVLGIVFEKFCVGK